MKPHLLDKKDFDYLFKTVLEEEHQRSDCIVISTWDLVRKLWEKYRVPHIKYAQQVREKMREWWNSYPWKYEPRPHKIVCGVAVFLAQPMGYDYCELERGKSLVLTYQNQREFGIRQ